MNSWVLITGGLGKAFATECAARGWNLALTDLKSALLENPAGGWSGPACSFLHFLMDDTPTSPAIHARKFWLTPDQKRKPTA